MIPAHSEDDLRQWRERALRMVMLVGAASGLPAYLSVIAKAFLDGLLTPILWIYSAGYLGFVLLIFLPRIHVRLRAWLFFGLTYAIAAASFARLGLAGSARLYLVFLPAAATILIGARGGYICLAISFLQYAGFASLARAGILSRWLTEPRNPLELAFWIEAGAALLMFLVTLTVLLERFTSKHVQTLSTSTRITAELEQAYASLEHGMQDRARELKLLNSVAAVVSGLVGIDRILAVSLEKTMEAFGIEAGGAYGLEEESETLVMLVHKGLSPGFVEQTERLDLVSALAGRDLRLDQPLSLAVADYPDGPLRRSIEAEGLKLIIGVPLAAKGRLVGCLVLNSRENRALSSEEESLLIALGQQVGLAIENARLRAQAEQTAAFAERNRLARELHDSVTQSLYSVTLYAEAAARLLDARRTIEAADHLRELGTTAREALREMRLLIFELGPPALETGSLADAIQTRLDAVEARGGLSVQFCVEGTERLSDECRRELYQIAQEALNNALKHSRAQLVKILLRFGETETRLEISDDGVGFNLAQAQKSGGLGLRSMRERAQRIAGSLGVDSIPAGGTRVSVTAPAARPGSARVD